MNLQEIRTTVHNRLNRLRALDRIVMSKQFEAALAKSTTDPPIDDPYALEAWIDSILRKELDDMSMGQLRVRASKLRIPFYTSFTKPNLILKIIEVQDARKAPPSVEGMLLQEVGRDSESPSECRRNISDSASSGGVSVLSNGIQSSPERCETKASDSVN